MHPCRICRAEVQILVHDPDQPEDCTRRICGLCAGKANRRILERMRPRRDEQ
jgi:hypothetical protein